MPSSAIRVAQLITGQRMDVEEFLRRWEKLPDVKRAELIDGVYVPSPLSLDHGDRDAQIMSWLGWYAAATPGCKAGNNSTWRMLDSAPQPDCALRILPERGGQSRVDGKPGAGAPELVVEICLTSAEVDFGPKLDLYRKAGVREYLTVELIPRRILWRVLKGKFYRYQDTPRGGVFRSTVFPGLWLDVDAFWNEDGAKLVAKLNAGLATPDHARFAARLSGSE